jgi:hypothetical protein
MDLVNLMYRYINKFINSDELLKEFNNIDLSKYPKKEINQINQLISDVQNIINNIPNEIDEIENDRISKVDHLLKSLEKAKNDSRYNINDEDAKLFVDKQYNELLKEKENKKDGGRLYEALFELLTKNPLVIKYAKKMNDDELLKFITRYISVPMPPVLTQEEFDDLVKAGIKDDKREALWRLAFNYNYKKINFSLIEDYFIEKRDSYYLIELISAVQEDLDIDKIIQKVISTKDKEFMNDCAKRAKRFGLITDKNI